MAELFIAVFLVMFAGLYLSASYIDAKYQWRMVDWLNGTCENPFPRQKREDSKQVSNASFAANADEKDKLIEALTERVQVLEKIVNEPAYELNKKINAL